MATHPDPEKAHSRLGFMFSGLGFGVKLKGERFTSASWKSVRSKGSWEIKHLASPCPRPEFPMTRPVWFRGS